MPLGKDIGFLPGDLNEKLEPWLAPIKDNLRFLLGAYGSNPPASGGKRSSKFVTEDRKSKFDEQVLQSYFEEGIIEVQALTFIRGRSIANAFIIIDETQNTNLHEIKTILTRVGENTKIVLTGDPEQIDNTYVDSVSNGLSIVAERFKTHSIAGHIQLIKGERSALATLASNTLWKQNHWFWPAYIYPYRTWQETDAIRNNSYFVIGVAQEQGTPPIPPAEYDENVIDFTWEESKSTSFSFTFSSTPIVTLEVLPSDGLENIVAFLGNVTSTGLTVNVSAPHTGQIVYRAINASSYPTVVSRSVVSTSYYYTASAGYSDLINTSELLVGYSLLASSTSPTSLFITTMDINNNGDADVAVVDTGSYGLTSTPVSLSAPITNRVYYLAVKP